MFHFIRTILTKIVERINNFLFYIFYTISLEITRLYLQINDRFKKDNQKSEYIATYYQSYFNINEYEITYNNQNHNLKFVENDFESFINNSFKDIDNILEEKNKILHCCVVDKSGNILIDCTDDIRSFRFYFDNKKDLVITWRLFLEHIISIKSEEISLDDCTLLLCKNDDELSEVSLILDNTNLDSHINL